MDIATVEMNVGKGAYVYAEGENDTYLFIGSITNLMTNLVIITDLDQTLNMM